CSRLDPAPTEEELFTKARAVFVGHVTRVELAGALSASELLAIPPWDKQEWQTSKETLESLPPYPTVEVTFRVVEDFQGQPPASGKFRALVGNYCSGPTFLVGSDHVFFHDDADLVRSNDEVRPAFRWPTAANDHEGAVPLLEKLRKLSQAGPR